MEINGREIHFLRTVRANCLLADYAPDHDIAKFNLIWESGDYTAQQKACAVFIAALSEGYERRKAGAEPGYVARPISVDEALDLDDDTFAALFQEALNAYTSGGKVTVETEPVPGKKTAGRKKSD